MVERYQEVYCGGEGEIIEKKSRFIATVQKVETEAEAVDFIDKTKKKYWDATHNCSAFVLGLNSEISRCSDDGEPGGTAGRPMLEVLLGEKIRNVAVVVTRYFGGTLLGTGGLVRAYSHAVKEGLAHCEIIEKEYALLFHVTTDYNGIGKVQYIIGKNGYPILTVEYTEQVVLQTLIPINEVGKAKAELTEATNGQAGLTDGEEVYYAVIDGKPRVF